LGTLWDWYRNTGASFYNVKEFEEAHPKFARSASEKSIKAH
jgi:hypothetical protein